MVVITRICNTYGCVLLSHGDKTSTAALLCGTYLEPAHAMGCASPHVVVVALYPCPTCAAVFLLPLDIMSQVAVSTCWFCIYAPAAVGQLAYIMAMLIRAAPWLVWGQWALECACSTATRGLWLVASLVLSHSNISSTTWISNRSPGPTVTAASCAHHEAEQQQCSGEYSAGQLSLLAAAAQAVAVQPGPAPDFSSTAGRLAVALGVAYILFAVLVLPLSVFWRLERHLKSKWMAAGHAQGRWRLVQEQQRTDSTGVTNVAATSPSTASSLHTQRDTAYTTGCLGDSSKFYSSSEVLPFLPKPAQFCKLLVGSCAACFVAAEAFVGLAVHCRAVASIVWPQITQFKI